MVARRLRGQKTYWHFLPERRIPNRYELLSSQLLYYPDKGLAVDTPAARFLRQHQTESALQAPDWERFSDPRATTYASYVALQREQEAYVDGLLSHAEEAGADTSGFHAFVADNVSALRYPCHGLMMLSAYVGQAAPSGRIVIAATFQAGDEMRRVHRLAYRLRMLTGPTVDDDGTGLDAGRTRWETDAAFQPMRRLIEQMLVTFDWGEAFAALNLVAKPLFDALLQRGFAVAAQGRGDTLTHALIQALESDNRWHRAWSAALVQCAIAGRPENRRVLQTWVERWTPRAIAGVQALLPELANDLPLPRLQEAHRGFLGECGLEPSG